MPSHETLRAVNRKAARVEEWIASEQDVFALQLGGGQALRPQPRPHYPMGCSLVFSPGWETDVAGGAAKTAVFLFSDHGEWGGDYGLVEKWRALSTNASTMFRWSFGPRIPAEPRVGEIVELYDVMATCLDLAGIEAQHTHFAQLAQHD